MNPRSSSNIVAVIGVCRRPDNVADITRALRSQTIAPSRIVVVYNDTTATRLQDVPIDMEWVAISWNSGVWARLFICQTFTEASHIALFDDDTIPGPKWLENCAKTEQETKAILLGANGVVFRDGERNKRRYYGTGQKTIDVTPVDIVGQAWFFPAKLLEYALGPFRAKVNALNIEGLAVNHPKFAGEDYWLSLAAWDLAAQHNIDIGVAVPPHPPQDPDMWGSTDPKRGMDYRALYREADAEAMKQYVHDAWRRAGWSPIELATTREEPCLKTNSE